MGLAEVLHVVLLEGLLALVLVFEDLCEDSFCVVRAVNRHASSMNCVKLSLDVHASRRP